MPDLTPIKTAIISVADKSGVVDLAQKLVAYKVKIISTGGTAKLLKANGIPHVGVSEYTQFPEIMGGRVKTLHPHIFGGILARPELDKDILTSLKLATIELVVVNLYPFAEAIKNQPDNLAHAIENIDIGGPSLIRAAAKNHENTTVVTAIDDYQTLIDEIDSNQGKTSLATRQKLAIKAFQLTSNYDTLIANHLQQRLENQTFPPKLNLNFSKQRDLRYGENPHQQAALYIQDSKNQSSVCTSKLLQGKPLSFNNIQDADMAWCAVNKFAKTACVIVKHANPCGVAKADDLLTAYQNAYHCDPTSAFGGIIAVNETIDAEVAKTILQQQFVEVIIAPSFAEEALEKFSQKTNLRLLQITSKPKLTQTLAFSQIDNGLLLQTADNPLEDDSSAFTVVSEQIPTETQYQDLLFAWQTVSFTKSNAIVIAKSQATIGIGMGQTSRVDSTQQAIEKAKRYQHNLQGAILASDAFFPFADNIELAAKAGISAIIQPGGSKRDAEVIAAANKYHIAMVFTHSRHFFH
ncbi:MAG: bifunctional phosphoribosylaminoimidazolecarboxamide formyltransferase/IMP cyclohydrolase [Pseudomonadota bacterium]